MIAGLIGLLLSISGLIGILIVRPGLQSAAKKTIETIYTSIDSSQQVMNITGETLTATVETVEILSSMLATTAQTMDDTRLILDQVNSVSGTTLPETLEAAITSLKSAEQSAASLDAAITSFETFRSIIGSTPLLSSLVPKSTSKYDPEKPLAESLGELAESLEGMPDTFIEMSENIEHADDNLARIQDDLTNMSESVGAIADGLKEYDEMVSESESSLEELKILVGSFRANLTAILNGLTITFGLFFLWLLAAQVVIFSQGWELYHNPVYHLSGNVEGQTKTDPEPMN
jgi:methyl-accepting chemotaxis protein